MSWGPWSATVSNDERFRQLRTLRAIVHMQVGPHHPLIDTLHDAEHDAMRYVAAFDAVERLPALQRRRLLATFSAITFRTPRK